MPSTFSLLASTALTVIADLAPLATDSSKIAGIISMLETWVPVIIKEATDLIQPVKNIIAALQGSASITADQLAALQALDAQCDAAFDAALAAYNAANPGA